MSGVLANLMCFCDLIVKEFRHYIILSGVKNVILLCVTCSVWFDDRKSLVSILQSDGCFLVPFIACHFKGLV